MADAENAVEFVALAHYARVIPALAEDALERVALADHASPACADNTITRRVCALHSEAAGLVVGPEYPRAARIVAHTEDAVQLRAFPYDPSIINAPAEDALERVALADNTTSSFPG
jgi:hypothetical protein